MATGTLTGQTIANTYKSLLKITGTTAGGETLHATTLKVAEDGDGNASPLQIAQNRIEIVPVANHANAFEVSQADGTQIFNIASDTPAASLTGTLSITTADNSDTISLISTDADANSGPNLRLYRNSGSPAGNDLLGNIQWEGRNNNSQDVVYAEMRAQIETTTDGSEDANFKWSTMKAGTSRDRLSINANATVFNDDSVDVDFRVESDGNTHMLYVDGGNNNVGIGAVPDSASRLLVDHDQNAYTRILVKNTDTGSAAQAVNHYETDVGSFTCGAVSDAHSLDGAALLWHVPNKSMVFATNNTQRMIIDNAGKVGVGTGSPAGAINLAGSGVGANVYIDAHSADADGGNLIFRKSRNATIGNVSDEPNSADALGSIYFQGADSDSWETGALIRANADENWSSSALGTALTFHTVDNTTTTLDERMRIDHNGKVGIGATAPGWSLDINNNETGDWAMHLGGDLDANGRWTGILMGYHSSSLYNKAGIVFKSYDATRVRGDLHFCIDDTDDDGNVADTEVAMTVYRTKNIGIGDTAPADAKLSISSVLSGDYGLKIDQDQNNGALYIDSESSSASVVHIDTPTVTTGSVINIDAANSLTTGSALRIVSASASNGTRDLIGVHNNDSGATGTTLLKLNQDANSNSLVIDSESTGSTVIHVDAPTVNTGHVLYMDPTSLTTGSAISVNSSSTALASTAAGGLVEILHTGNSGANANNLMLIHNDNSSSSGTTCLAITQDAANYGINIDQNANQKSIYIDSEATSNSVIHIEAAASQTDSILNINDADALTSGRIANFHSGASNTTARNLVAITNDNGSASGATGLLIDQNANAISMNIDSEATTNHTMTFTSPAQTTGFVMSISDANDLTSGSLIYAHSNSDDNTARDLVQIANHHASADNAVCLKLHQDGDDAHIEFAGAGGGGIKFAADISSSDSDTLDDYEEGTWTPQITLAVNSVAYDAQEGHYTKIGRFVHATAYIDTNATGTPDGSTLRVSLPFTGKNVTNGYASWGVVLVSTGAANSADVSIGVNDNAADAYCVRRQATGTTGYTGNDFGDNGVLQYTCVYQI